jgi:hypothetical protein
MICFVIYNLFYCVKIVNLEIRVDPTHRDGGIKDRFTKNSNVFRFDRHTGINILKDTLLFIVTP